MTTPKTEAHADREHSDLVGGSSAAQRLNCPRSYQLEQHVPYVDKTSEYAEEGTALHEAVQHCLENDIVNADDILGMKFNGFNMTRALVDEGVKPCLDFFDELDESLDAEGGMEFLLEKRSEMPGIPGAFGTADLIGRTAKRSIVADWKFGVGVPVYAEYTDEEGEVHTNEQLMFYGRAAMHSHPEMFGEGDDWPVDLYIVQPRARQGSSITKATVTRKQLEAFRMRLVAAIAEATSPDARVRRGPWCEFKRCKAVCPKWTGPLLDLSKINADKLEEACEAPVLAEAPLDWAKLFGIYLPVCDAAEETFKTVRKLAQKWLEDGNAITDENGEPTYKLVPKRATETYTDEDGMLRHAVGLGLDEKDARTEPVLKSPAQMRAALEPLMEGGTKKARTEEAKEQISKFTAQVSSGNTLAPVTDGRPDVTPTPRLVNELARKLGMLDG